MKIRFFIILAVSILCCCELVDPTKPIDSRSVIKIEAVDASFNVLNSKQTLLADSLSSCIIKVTLNKKSDGAQEIVLSTTDGLLTNVGHLPSAMSTPSLIITPQDREIFVQLNALDIAKENVLVSAVVNNVSSVLAFNFDFKYPEQFIVYPQNIQASVDEEVEFSIAAFVKSGVVSEGHRVMVKDQRTNDIVLDYPKYVDISDQKGNFKITNTTRMSGLVKIEIVSPVSATDSVSNLVTIMYQ